MDIRFDKAVATRLVRTLNDSCDTMLRETQTLMQLLKQSTAWNDYQKEAFETNLNDIAMDLQSVLNSEESYMEEYKNRVIELGG